MNKGRRRTSRRRAGSSAIFLDLNNLMEFRHLSFAQFVRFAIVFAIGKGEDPFDKPIDNPSAILDNVKGFVDSLISDVEERYKKVNNFRSRKALETEKEELGEILAKINSDQEKALNTEFFMDYEFKEYVRIWGGRGKAVRDILKTRSYMLGLYELGMYLTRIARGGRNDKGAFLLVEPSYYLHYYNKVLDVDGFRKFYFTIRNFMRYREEIQRQGRDHKLGETAFLTLLSGLAIDKLFELLRGKHGYDQIYSEIMDLVNNGALVLHRVSESGVTPYDLTNLAKVVLRMRAADALADIARSLQTYHSGGRHDIENYVANLANIIGGNIFAYAIGKDLRHIYYTVRSIVAGSFDEDMNKALGAEGWAKLKSKLLSMKVVAWQKELQ
jgi:hypothetical protein